MKLKDLIQNSYYSSVGYIESQDDIDKLEQYIIYNLEILKLYKGVISSTTYKEDNLLLIEAINSLWLKYFPNSISICNGISRGHSFGACDNDDAVFNYCKKNNISWICKSANDILLDASILDIEIDNADFYYYNGIGFGGMINYDFDFDKIIKEDFYPQTNFYFINISKTDYLNDRVHVEEIYSKILKIQDYSGRAWEYGFRSCEGLLADCVNRNSLKKYHLINKDSYLKLLDLVKNCNIHDCSHKNIMISGQCHFHHSDQEIIVI
jgi:hypothetical protein